MDTFLPLSRSNVRSTDIDFYSFSSPLFSSFQCSKPRVHQFHPSYLTYTYNEIWWSHLIIIDWTNISSQFPYFWLNIHECVCARERYKQAHKQTNGLISSTNRMIFFSFVWHFYDFVSIQFAIAIVNIQAHSPFKQKNFEHEESESICMCNIENIKLNRFVFSFFLLFNAFAKWMLRLLADTIYHYF